jgi:hypothetical protein
MLVLLGWKSPTTNSDLLTALRDGGFLTTSQAALICDVSDQTIRDWIEHAASIGQPIAERLVTWIVIREFLLDYVEEHCGGRHERVKVERRFDELWPRWPQARNCRTDAKVRAAG